TVAGAGCLVTGHCGGRAGPRGTVVVTMTDRFGHVTRQCYDQLVTPARELITQVTKAQFSPGDTALGIESMRQVGGGMPNGTGAGLLRGSAGDFRARPACRKGGGTWARTFRLCLRAVAMQARSNTGSRIGPGAPVVLVRSA
ncbi:hypothetical protein ABZ590_38430, partial [Streptomyces hirsutus]